MASKRKTKAKGRKTKARDDANVFTRGGKVTKHVIKKVKTDKRTPMQKIKDQRAKDAAAAKKHGPTRKGKYTPIVDDV